MEFLEEMWGEADIGGGKIRKGGWAGGMGGLGLWGERGVFTRGMPGGEVWRLGEEGMSMTSRGYSGWMGDKQGGGGVIY